MDLAVINVDRYGDRLGEDFGIGFSLTDPSTGLPIPVTGSTGTLTLWDFKGNVIATASIVIDDGDNGIFHYTIPGATTGGFVWEYMRYCVTNTWPSGVVQDMQRGTIYWEPKIP